MKQYRYARAGRQYRSIPALFRDDLLIFQGERRLFAESFVPLHPQNIKTKDIMPEISKFYGIIIYMYIDDHRSISKTKPRVRHLINVKEPHFLHFEA